MSFRQIFGRPNGELSDTDIINNLRVLNLGMNSLESYPLTTYNLRI